MLNRERLPRLARTACLAACLSGLAACGAIKKAAINNVASTLAEPGDTFTSDNDPELIRSAIPFGLKFYESLLVSVPRNEELLRATCSNYTSYAFAFVETDADLLRQEENHDKVKALKDEAFTLYMRAKDYCLRAMEVRFPGITKPLVNDPVPALKRANDKSDVPLLYWTAASWGAAMSLRKDPELVIDFPVVRALAERALALDETWSNGAIHELMITLDAQGELFGGSEEGARRHYARAVEIQQGLMAGPHVALAMGVGLPKGDRAEFESLLEKALAVDPEKRKSERLVNIITQRRARSLQARLDELFPK
jgi:predicted anti-sigma-YlaC factor YlaD